MAEAIWVNRVSGVPTIRDFNTTNGFGPPICVDTTSAQAYYLAPGDLITPISASKATGVLFDTDSGDKFTDLIYTPHASLTVGASQAAFVSSSATDQILALPNGAKTGTFYHCFDHWTMEAIFTATDFVAAGVDGLEVGSRVYTPLVEDYTVGYRISSHGGSATTILPAAVTGNAILEYDAAAGAGLPKQVMVRYEHNLTTNSATHTHEYDTGGEVSLTKAYGAGSLTTPTKMMTSTLRFKRGTLTCVKLKFSAKYPNAKFAFIGDSLTVGAATSPLTGGFAHKLRVRYPNNVLIAGASGATTEDWQLAVDSVVRMKPKYAIICLGTNDRAGGWSVDRSQTAMTSVVNTLIDAGIIPILLSSPPIGNGNVPTFNTWLAAQGWLYVDIYTTLVGSGTSLAAGFNSGDGVHWNAAGHNAVDSQLLAFIVSQGL